LDNFVGLQTGGGTGSLGNQKVVIGPWTHTGVFDTNQGELEYPENSVIDYDELMNILLRWYNYWLKDEDNDIMDIPPVRYYRMGDAIDEDSTGNSWIEASGWPIPSVTKYLYFSPESSLTASPSLASSESFVYDPTDPVPTLGGANLELTAGPYNQSTLEERDDVLVYSSEVLTEPLDITGRIKVVLYGSSSAVDTDWTAKLCDVYPDGKSMLVTDGILHAKYRNGFEELVLMTPGEVYQFEIDLWSTSIVFNTGHRIRVDISSSNYPRFEANPNTGDPLRTNTEVLSATNTVYFGSTYPSRIVLPVVSPEDHPIFEVPTLGIPLFELY
jgi:putative CocE/NonD family hydrolase